MLEGEPQRSSAAHVQLRAEIDALTSIAGIIKGADGHAEVESAQRAVKFIDAQHVCARALAEFALALARQRIGQVAETEIELNAILSDGDRCSPGCVSREFG